MNPATRMTPRRRTLMARARRALWELVRERGPALARSALRRRLSELVRRLSPSGLATVLRRGALKGALGSALVAALLTPGRAAAQTIELGDIAKGQGGFLVSVDSRSHSNTGATVAMTGDVNGDGVPDMIVAGEYGPAHVVFGKRDGRPLELTDVEAGIGGFVIRGKNASRSSVSGAGDISGDGLEDLIVGFPRISSPGVYDGARCYVVFGKRDGQPVDLADVEAGRGGFAIRYAVRCVGVKASGPGDFNGDGVPDILLSVNLRTTFRNTATESYLVFGKRDGVAIDLADVRSGQGGLAIGEPIPGGGFGSIPPSLAGAGDVNGDGLADLLIGVSTSVPLGRTGAGESYVVFGRPDAGRVDLSEIEAGVGGFAILGPADNSLSGALVTGAGDVNGDGLADVVIGEGIPYGGRPDGQFQSFVVFGKRDGGAVDLSQVEASGGGFTIRSESKTTSSISGAGDVNGDGFADLVLGSRLRYGGADSAGESYVVFGKPDGGIVELSEVGAGSGGFVILGIAPGDFPGTSVSGGGDVSGDGLADLLVGAPRASPEGRPHVGESYLVPGKKDGEPIQLAAVNEGRAPGFAIRGIATNGDLSISSLSGAGDFNGDGLLDFILGARYADAAGRGRAGESFVIFGKGDGERIDLDEVRAGRGGFAIEGARENDRCGTSVSGAGDFNGDGLADLLIGAPGASLHGGPDSGMSYVVYGKRDGKLIDLEPGLTGPDGFEIRGMAGSGLGSSVSGAGDVDGDGIEDLAIAAPWQEGRWGTGKIYVVFGKPDGDAVQLTDIDGGQGGFAIKDGCCGITLGRSAGRDVNGDGLADILIHAYAGTDIPEPLVVFGKWDGNPVRLFRVAAGEGGGFAIQGGLPGSNIQGAGDIDGDGLADILIGSPSATPASNRLEAGESYVVSGKATTEAVKIADLQTSGLGFVIRGGEAHARTGSSVSDAGDLNGDGLSDVIVSNYNGSLQLQEPSGAYIVFGKADRGYVDLAEVHAGRGGFSIRASESDAGAGRIVSGAGDVNGDGLPDVLLSARLTSASFPRNSGAVYVVFGRDTIRSPRFRRGATGDADVLDLSDAIRLLGYLFLGDAEPPCLDAADADDSGTLDVTDAVRVLAYLFLGGEAPSDPGPLSCGVDPTGDALGCATPTQGCSR